MKTKKYMIILSVVLLSCTVLTGCNTENSGVKIDEDKNITIDINKSVDNVDSFITKAVDKVVNTLNFKNQQ